MKDFEFMQPLLGLIIIAGLIGVLVCMFFYPLPEGVKEIVLMLIGVLSKSFSDVVNYYFGSTASSKTKDKTISDMVLTPSKE